MIFENSNITVYILLFISLVFVVIGVYFLIKKKDKNIITKPKIGDLSITEITGSSYNKKIENESIITEISENIKVEDTFNIEKTEIKNEVDSTESEEDNNVVEYTFSDEDDDAVEYTFSDEDDNFNEIYDEENEIDINDIVLKIDNIGNELKKNKEEGTETKNILEIENMIFGNDKNKEESFNEVEKILENKVDAFIMNLSNENEDIRKYIIVNGGKNYLEEYNNRIKY